MVANATVTVYFEMVPLFLSLEFSKMNSKARHPKKVSLVESFTHNLRTKLSLFQYVMQTHKLLSGEENQYSFPTVIIRKISKLCLINYTFIFFQLFDLFSKFTYATTFTVLLIFNDSKLRT